MIDLVRADLVEVLGADRVSVATGDLDQHSADQSSQLAHRPDLIVWPRNALDVSAVLRCANERGVAVTAWGAGTSLEGNPIPIAGGIVLDFRDMNRIVALHAEDFQVTVEPGLLYKDMNRELGRHGLFFAPDPGANASIGGMIANNAAGVRTVKYGATRDNVLALEVVLAGGAIIRTGSRAVKQSCGYDLTHVFAGSEGTLGIITQATLKLDAIPEHASALVAAFPSVHDAARTVFAIMAHGLEPAAMELLDAIGIELINRDEGMDLPQAPHLFMEFVGGELASLDRVLASAKSICIEHGATHVEIGTGNDERTRLWQVRHRFFETLVRNHPGQHFLIADVAVPISALPELIDRTYEILERIGIRGQIIGHAGDGNLHVTLFYPPDDAAERNRAHAANHALVEAALALGGTATGEHGVGIGKKQFLEVEHGAEAVAVMRGIKAALDPHGILNPGKIFDDGIR